MSSQCIKPSCISCPFSSFKYRCFVHYNQNYFFAMTIIRSPYPNVEVPEIALTPYLLELARKRGNRPAIIDQPSGNVLTYGDFVNQVLAVASSLSKKLGFQK